MDPFVELTIEMSLLIQQLRMGQMTNEHHQRVRNPQMSMDHVWYGGAPHLSNYNIGGTITRIPHEKGDKILPILHMSKDQAWKIP